MKKSALLLLATVMFGITVLAQTFQIGHTTQYFYDSDRGDREIQTEIYYPANSTGDDVALASGEFPVLVFGHGFVMAWDSYANFWEEFVPNGYIMVFPRTEGNISPSHEAFGLDLAFLTDAMQDEHINASSLFYGKVAPKTAVMGHSMGGGSSFIAAEANPNITTMISFAAAETTPSSIGAAANINIPTVVFSGDSDGVAPPAEHQTPMYNALASECKTFISLIDGGHCYFANYNFNCSFGEMTAPPLPRDEVHAITFDFLNLWLDYTLRNNYDAFLTFNDSLQTSSRINFEQTCDMTKIPENNTLNANICPNPVENILSIELENCKGKSLLKIYDLIGNIIDQRFFSEKNIEYPVNNMSKGIYFLQITNNTQIFTQKIIKL